MISIFSKEAPGAIGAYSQAIQAGNSIYISGQIPLRPGDSEIIKGGFENQSRQVFRNLHAVAQAAQCDYKQFVKLTIYLTDLANYAVLNKVMSDYFSPPFPARAVVEVSALPKQSLIEADAILCLPSASG